MSSTTPNVQVLVDHPGSGLEPQVGHLIARADDGLERVEIRLRWDGFQGTRSVLRLLARVCIEVLVQARAVKPVASVESEGRRWHG